MQLPDGEASTLGHFALVGYIPNPLARFLDDLRVELDPPCKPRAHVTILPPHPHFQELDATLREITERCRVFDPFHIELGRIEIFDESNVVYLGLKSGVETLHAMYKALNFGPLKFKEYFPYHPHITIAQDLTAADSVRAAARAQQRWDQYTGPRGFDVNVLSFVQHVAPNIWVDVAAVPLGAATHQATRS
jgi:2'-5' RNA ligase